MKILFVNRPKAWWIGGDYFQMERIAEEMRKFGHDVTITEVGQGGNLMVNQFNYDVIHTFNFSMGWSKVLMNPKAPHQKYVSSMIYHELDFFASYPDQQVMLDNLDAALFLTDGETERVKRHLKLDPKKVFIVPNGIDEAWFKPYWLAKLKQKVDPFVLTVGRVEDNKGQGTVALACQKLGRKYISIGGHEKYYNKKDRIYFMLSMSQEKLRKYYASCGVFALVSQTEVMPLTVMEAGAQAKNIVLTTGCEWEVPNAEYVKFGDVEGAARAIELSIHKPPNFELQEMLRKMTWENVAKQIINIYETI